jgi:ferredoxin-thioredoxin reductase catalytic subunit
MASEITPEQIEVLFERLKKEARDAGYFLNPDTEFTKDLIRSILINQQRYGYWACPCRLATGIRKSDLDIICPCDYRDEDITDFGSCFCALYVSKKIAQGEGKAVSIPERRPSKEEKDTMNNETGQNITVKMPVWRCKVCGYLCARDSPPDVCPICKVDKDRFERFM